ncbi:DUF1643 domain-containing protein [Pseudomonas sp. NPDC090202]|uniref:DUF1643 domain-containing protein n=1 Tax=unclassified Pseudomonas TaxID=196821 RepID=UPI00381DCE50
MIPGEQLDIFGEPEQAPATVPAPIAAPVVVDETRTALLSDCGVFRYRLGRVVQPIGRVFAFFGICPSKGDPLADDFGIANLTAYSLAHGGARFLLGNVFAYRTNTARELATVPDPYGPDNAAHLAAIIAEADVLVPCWGSRDKEPEALAHHFDTLTQQLLASDKPVMVFGYCLNGDPAHALMINHDKPLIPWSKQ